MFANRIQVIKTALVMTPKLQSQKKSKSRHHLALQFICNCQKLMLAKPSSLSAQQVFGYWPKNTV